MPESGQKQILLTKIQNNQALIGIIGLGYVGLPLALAYAEKGFKVLGFDVDPKKIEALDRGECYISPMDSTRIAQAMWPHPSIKLAGATTMLSDSCFS